MLASSQVRFYSSKEKTKVQKVTFLKVGFCSDAREESFLVSQKTFSEQFLKEP